MTRDVDLKHICTWAHPPTCVYIHNPKLISTRDLHMHWALLLLSPNPQLQTWVDPKALSMLLANRRVRTFPSLPHLHAECCLSFLLTLYTQTLSLYPLRWFCACSPGIAHVCFLCSPEGLGTWERITVSSLQGLLSPSSPPPLLLTSPFLDCLQEFHIFPCFLFYVDKIQFSLTTCP